MGFHLFLYNFSQVFYTEVFWFGLFELGLNFMSHLFIQYDILNICQKI